jgi:DNA helicase-2/ATP-dependent DNA helicase PcrA
METYLLRPRPAPKSDGRFRIDYARELNPAQLEAATTLEGPVLVIAGAGSGKTRTLVYRVARLVESGVPPGRILLLTFTRKAAEEMLRRAGALVGASCEQVAGGTFHSFANTVLRRLATRVGLTPGFTILDRADAEDVIALLRTRAGLDRKDRRFPRKGAILEILSMAVNRSTTVPELVETSYAHLCDHLDDLVRLAEEYTRYKREKNLVDYDDLLVLLRDLLRDHADVALKLSRTFRYVMVDEYQDTNRLQAEIVRGLAVAHQNVMAVGDDSQSIYSFRGATFRNIMDFPQLFPGTRIVKLEENYRSTQPILGLANAIIDRAAEKHTKVLRARTPGGGPPLLVQCTDEQAQSRFVCQRILELREEGVPLDEIAVLFRSSFHSFDLELELGRHDLPFVKRGGFKFIETAHVKDVLAHLRVLVNPRDAVSWHRVLCLLDGLGPKTAEDVLRHLGEPEDATEAAARLARYPRRGAYTAELARLATLVAETAAAEAAPAEKLERVVGFYVPMLRHLHPEDFPKRERDLEHFLTIAARYRSLQSLLADMALEPPTDSVGDVLAAGGDDEGLLTLSTIHSAKGLEWRAVFVIWLVDGRFPSYHTVDDQEQVEEERRLLYVAVTRAKEHLYLSYPIDVYDRSSGMVLGQPSRFVDGLPAELLPGLQVVDETAASWR